MMVCFSKTAWQQYLYWRDTDDKKLDKINALIKDVLRSPYQGLGKPEPLKGDYSGYWSRRIDGEHRLIYKCKDDMLIIVACRHHY